MTQQQQSLDTLEDIRRIMERSSRFISLSGLSGISAGVFALIGAWLAYDYVFGYKDFRMNGGFKNHSFAWLFDNILFWIATGTFLAAVLSAFMFTWIKSKKNNVPLWGKSAIRLLINLFIPLVVGAIFLFRMIHFGTFGLVAPGCLIFYGLALINASKYTLDDVRYLGYIEILLGLVNLWFIGYGLYFWAAGFGLMHIIYGGLMWWKYDR